jgi:hypothetical protein
MKLTEILEKSMNIVSEKPVILIPCIIPAALTLIQGFVWPYAGGLGRYWEGFQPWDMGPGGPGEFTEMWTEFLPQQVFAMAAVNAIVSIIIWFTAVYAFSMVIFMTAAAFEGKDFTLSEAFHGILGKIPMLVLAAAIVWVLKFFGICTLCIVTFIVWILFALVKQGIILDNLGFDSFSASYNIARKDFFDIMLILGLFFVIKSVIGLVLFLVPPVGDALGYFVDIFSVAALTIFYIDRKG